MIGSFEIIGSRNALGKRAPSFADENIAKQLTSDFLVLYDSYEC